MSEQILAVFAGDGPLAAADDGYRERDGQKKMAETIAETIAENDVLMVDAGTGIGKTFAYLVPVLLSGKRALISTATRQLQDQLFQRDVQRVRQALGVDEVDIAILKGRNNYVCPVHLERNLADGRFRDPQIPQRLRMIERFFAINPGSGDRAAFKQLSEEDPAWQFATSTRDNCLGQECPELRSCPLMKARQQAQKADLLIVNHHLFCADLALKDESIGDFLPQAEIMVFDEAHQLPEIATEFFGETVSTRQLLDLGRETLRAGNEDAPGLADWYAMFRGLERVASRLRLALPIGITRLGADELLALTADDVNEWLEDVLPDVIGVLEDHADQLKPVAAVSADLMRLEDRARELARRLVQWLRAFRALVEPVAAASPVSLSDRHAKSTAQMQGDETGEDRDTGVADVDAPRSDEALILWVQTTETHAQLRATPLSVATRFASQRQLQTGSWIFVSATLALQDSIDHFAEQIGLPEARQLIVQSPFDYGRQASLWIPREVGSATGADFPTRVADCVWPLIRKNRGRAFVLCTTLRAVRLISERLRELAGGDGISVMAQGDTPRHQLVEDFKKAKAAVLVGSAGFWEGVDIVGDDLSLVVIDKLPFAPPDDPVFRARSRALAASGRHAFQALALPQAMLALKQGVGRLIRSENDHGLLVICDERLRSRGYGRQILASLPPFRPIDSMAEALQTLEDRPGLPDDVVSGEPLRQSASDSAD